MKFLKNKNVLLIISIFALISIFTLVGYITYGHPQTGIDDANITFVYAKNFAAGHGFVYNIGGEKVEGFSSMLWVLVTSVAFKFFSSPEFIILLFSISVLSLAFTYFSNFIIRKFNNRFKSVLFLGVMFAWIVAIPNFVVWGTITLMEFGFYSAILLSIVTFLLKVVNKSDRKFDNYLFAFLLILLALIRPESLLWIPAFLVIYFAAKLVTVKSFKTSIVNTLLPLVAGVGTIAALIAFRLAYFGYPFPNTYYAKVSTNLLTNFKDGYYYLMDFVNSNSFIPFLIGLNAVLFVFLICKGIYNLRKKRVFLETKELEVLVLNIVIAVGLFIPIYNGGDHFKQFRFLQPIWPMLIISSLLAFNLLNIDFSIFKFRRLYSAIFVLTAAFFIFYSANVIIWHKYKEQKDETIYSQFFIAKQEQDFGRFVNTFFAPLNTKPEIGVLAAGGFKLVYNGEVNDLLGLNNLKMAHASGEKIGIKNHASFSQDVFFNQLPEIINLYEINKPDFTLNDNLKIEVNFWNTVLKDLYDNSKFHDLYSEVIIENRSLGKYVYGYFRKDYLETLDTNVYLISVNN